MKSQVSADFLTNAPASPREETGLQRIVRLAAHLLGFPAVFVHPATQKGIWAGAAHGIDFNQVNAESLLFTQTIQANDLITLSIANENETILPVLNREDLTFYAGTPLTSSTGLRLGIMVFLDHQTRHFEAGEHADLNDLVALAACEIESHLNERASIAVAERLRLLESVAVHANDSILITEAEPLDEPGPRIVYVNTAFIRTTGYTAEETLGRTPRFLQGPATSVEGRARIRHALAAREPVVEELLNYKKDGTPFWVELSIVPVADESGELTHFISLQREVTERKQNEAVLRAAKEEAEAANLSKNKFLSRMSHELRTPLNAILGFGQLLGMSSLSRQDADSTRQIIKAGRHLLGLINEVLEISRIESGNLSVSLEAVKVCEIGIETFDLIRPLASRYGVELQEAEMRTCECSVQADRQRLKQVLLNLLSNAIKYNRPAGRISIYCIRQETHLRIAVQDTGQGIEPSQISRVFVPFDRLGAEKTEIEGTGVGLALCKRLIEVMGGEIGVESSLGVGSTFWIDLPLSQSPSDRVDAMAPSLMIPTALTDAQWSILYIEDNLSNVELLTRLLKQRPAICLLTAMHGNLGVELARQHHPDLILLDLDLPESDSESVLRRLRHDPDTMNIPIVIVSADATPGQIKRFLDAGAQNYLTKPLDLSNFMRIVDSFTNLAA